MTESQQRLSITEMRKAIRHAGYLLEIETATKLRNKGFRVETNPPYPDPKTGIQREIDLVASHADLFRFGSRPDDWLCPVVVVECKKSKTPITLFTTEWSRDFESDGHERWEALQIVGHPRLDRVTQDEKTANWSWLAASLNLQEFHHYATSSVATQFCGYKLKEGKKVNGKKEPDYWEAHHADGSYEALSTLIAATTYQMQKCCEDPPESTKSLNLEIFYPVLLLESKLYEAKLDGKTKGGFRIQEVNQLQYRYTAIRGARQEDFQVDIVTSAYFPKFMEDLIEESREMAKRINLNYDRVRDVIAARQRRHRRQIFREHAPALEPAS